jgi:hypothetical protein
MSYVVTSWQFAQIVKPDQNEFTVAIEDASRRGWEIKGYAINSGFFFAALQRPISTSDPLNASYPE